MKYKTAKEIFWKYSCNYFFLDHDGMTDEYVKKGGGNKSDEEKWRKEYINFWFTKISTSEIEAFRNLGYAEAQEILYQLIKYNSFRDDYIKFWYAYTLFELSKSSNFFLKIIAKYRAKEIFKKLTKKNIVILEINKKEIDNQMLDAMDAKKPEDYVRHYSKKMLMKF